MNRSYTKLRHIQKSNLLFESRQLNKKVLLEYDIYDDNTSSIDQELNTISQDITELNPQLDFSTVESAENTLGNSGICQIGDDVNGFVNRTFGQKIKGMFPDKAQEVINTVGDYISKFIDFLSTLKLTDLKSLLKDLKNKKTKTDVVSEEIIKEFFGTSMALVTIGSFTMPALVLTIATSVLVALVGFWLLKNLLCSFNISMSSKKRCRVRSFEWGQCK